MRGIILAVVLLGWMDLGRDPPEFGFGATEELSQL
jgi:hypothetical protein